MKDKGALKAFQTWYRNTIRNSKYRWLIILGSLLYVLSPVDISPDFIPFLGWVDDGLVATLLITEVSQLMMERLKAQSKTSGSSEKGFSNHSSEEYFSDYFTGNFATSYGGYASASESSEPDSEVIDVDAVVVS